MSKEFLTIEQAKSKGNEGQNQTIKGKFIAQHVFANVNQMTEYILKKGFEDADAPFNLDDVINFYSYPEFIGKRANFEGGSYEERKSEIERLEDLKNEVEEDENLTDAQIEEIQTEIESDIEDLENLESEAQEVYEWYLVSGYLADKLQEKGNPIIESENIWGRCTTGQAILLDYVITEICAEMEILEGQANSWA